LKRDPHAPIIGNWFFQNAKVLQYYLILAEYLRL
jgi:hypothetical protein